MVQGAIAGAQLGTVAGAWSTLGDKQHWQRVLVEVNDVSV
jgi:hypothetical protein